MHTTSRDSEDGFVEKAEGSRWSPVRYWNRCPLEDEPRWILIASAGEEA